MRTTPALAFVALAAAACSADVYIEVAERHDGPNGQHDGGAAMFSEDELGIWLWTDEPGTMITSLGFDIDGSLKVGNGAAGDYLFDGGVGTADPLGYFDLFAGDGVLTNEKLIDNVEYATLFNPVAIPVGVDNAILIYEGFTGTPYSAGAGVIAVVNFIQTSAGSSETHTYGWYQTPAPGAIAFPLGACALASRRRRA